MTGTPTKTRTEVTLETVRFWRLCPEDTLDQFLRHMRDTCVELAEARFSLHQLNEYGTPPVSQRERKKRQKKIEFATAVVRKLASRLVVDID